jgi:hypothetical protein
MKTTTCLFVLKYVMPLVDDGWLKVVNKIRTYLKQEICILLGIWGLRRTNNVKIT